MLESIGIGGATLHLGDCRVVAPCVRANGTAVITDPPYSYHGNEYLFDIGAVQPTLDMLVPRMPAYIFWPCTPPYPCGEPSAVHIWHKAIPIHKHSEVGNVSGNQYERILSYGLGKKSEVFRIAGVMPNFAACKEELTPHPTQKPVRLMEELVSRTKAETIFDPFMGSGSTGVACANLGRKFIGVEIERKYFDIACERIGRAYQQQRLFA